MKKRWLMVVLPLILFIFVAVGIDVLNRYSTPVYDYPLFHEGLVAVYNDGKYGYVNKKGNFKIELQYESAENFHNGVAVVQKEGKYYLINPRGGLVTKKGYDYLINSGDTNRIIFSSNQKAGILNTKGRVVLDAVYDRIFSFSNGYATYEQNGKKGKLNESGKVVISAQYDSIGDFREGVATFSQDKKHGYINEKGKIIVEPVYEDAEDFYKGYGIVRYTKNNKKLYGVVDKTGKLVYSGFDFIERTKNKFLVKKGQDTGLVNPGEKEINFGPIYSEIESEKVGDDRFTDYLVAEDSKGEYRYILNEAGKVVSKYETGRNSNSYRRVYHFIDPYTMELYIAEYYDFDEYIFGKGPVSIRDFNGNFFYISARSSGVAGVMNKYFVVSENGKYAVYNMRGTKFFDGEYDSIRLFSDGYAIVVEQGYYGIFTIKGKEILPTYYTYISR